MLSPFARTRGEGRGDAAAIIGSRDARVRPAEPATTERRVSGKVKSDIETLPCLQVRWGVPSGRFGEPTPFRREEGRTTDRFLIAAEHLFPMTGSDVAQRLRKRNHTKGCPGTGARPVDSRNTSPDPCKSEGPHLAARPFHCLCPDADSSAELLPRYGGLAHQNCRARHGTMRHQTTSFPLLNDIEEVGSRTATRKRQVFAKEQNLALRARRYLSFGTITGAP